MVAINNTNNSSATKKLNVAIAKKQPTQLAQANLGQIGSTGQVSMPSYDRTQVTAGIVHFGVSNFFRAHQAVYFDDLMNAGHAHDWGVVGVSVTKSGAEKGRLLGEQDYLTMVSLNILYL
jgi:mannitol 2-dehydrogenase